MHSKKVIFCSLYLVLVYSCDKIQKNTPSKLEENIEILSPKESGESEIVYYSLDSALKKKDVVYQLHLREKGYKDFPSEVCSFSKLKRLDISMNVFSELAPEINQLKDLEELTVAYGRLKSIPPEVGELKKLKELNLLDN